MGGFSNIIAQFEWIQELQPLWFSIIITGFIIHADINECDIGTDECHDNASCSDTIGSYECTCDIGFTGDGYNCSGKILNTLSTSCLVGEIISYNLLSH